MATGVVVLSFAKRSENKEPGPVNIKLARATATIVDDLTSMGEFAILVTQWEVAKQLAVDNEPTGYVVTPQDASIKPNGQRYLESEDVLSRAYDEFRKYNIDEVIVVANKFLHLQAVQKSVRSAGFTVIKTSLPWVGFDPSSENLQWWTKGPIRFIAYLAILVVGKLTKHSFNGIGERQTPH